MEKSCFKLFLVGCVVLFTLGTICDAENKKQEIYDFKDMTVTITKPTKKPEDSCGCTSFQCGVPNRENRVLGGSRTDAIEYPWLAYLTYRGKLYCGASLINNQYLVTAAHCIQRVFSSRVIVHLGKHHRTKSKDSEQEMKVKDWWIHSDFSRRTFQNDIGVIKLKKPVMINDYVRPICLPTGDGNYTGEFGTVVGWGRTSEKGKSSDYPNEIRVPIMSNHECKEKKYNPRDITTNMFCAGYDQGKIDACQGDSGGPLMREIRGSRGQLNYELTGIVSWGQGCGRAGYPGVYTRVGKYLEFVKKHIPENCYCNR